MADHPALVALEYNIIYYPMQVTWLPLELNRCYDRHNTCISQSEYKT